MKSSDIHIRVIPQEMAQASIIKICLKITCLQFHWNFPGANEFINTKDNIQHQFFIRSSLYMQVLRCWQWLTVFLRPTNSRPILLQDKQAMYKLQGVPTEQKFSYFMSPIYYLALGCPYKYAIWDAEKIEDDTYGKLTGTNMAANNRTCY